MPEMPNTDPTRPAPDLPADIAAVIGIGVAKASQASLTGILSAIEPGLGGVYLVVIGGEDHPSAEAVLAQAAAVSTLTLVLAEDGASLQPEHVYICGPDRLMTLEAGRLSVRERARDHTAGAVDTMLDSIARTAGRRSVAVILNGLQSEGAVGLRSAKECGGLSIGEWDPGDEDGSETAGPSGVLDLRGTPARIAAEIDLYIGNIAVLPEASLRVTAEAVETQISEIVAALRRVTGNDFHGYKRGTFVRRVQRRLQVLQMPDIAAYIELLRENREEVQRLFQDLLIGVTQFFRDPQEFDLLERQLPTLFRDKGPQDTIRIWVLGCATGEEAYSIAILAKEYAATLSDPPRIQIFATDLDARALGLARAARYAPVIADHIRPDRLERWFTREGDTYSVVKELREICIFSPHNLVKDAPFSRIDLLSCRNLLIYLNIEIQDRTIPLFHFALRAGGMLMLGSSENVTRHQTLFAPIDRKNRLFRRLEPATRVVPEFPQSVRQQVARSPAYGPAEPLPPSRLSETVSRQADAVAERFAPAYVVVDTQFDVLHFSGRIGRFLEPLSGAATLSLINLVHRDLRVELRSALYRAVNEGQRIDLSRQVLKLDDGAICVNIVIEPLSRDHITSLVVVFQKIGKATEDALPDETSTGVDDHVNRLEHELRLTRERLQATIEELESTNEELRSSNEEYQSINEELQSTNEELETSKEELQSVNEELQTVNLELGHQVGELARSNSDVKNLLDASQIATIFLDNDLRLRSFTPSATDVFHLLDTDVGRPLDHVVSRVTYPEIREDVFRVLKTLVASDRIVIDPARARHYAVRVMPYRSIDNFIGGAVLTFTDLTATRNAERALRDSEERFRNLVGTWAQSVWEADATGQILPAEGEGGKSWLDMVHPEDARRGKEIWQAAIVSHQVLNAEFRLACPDNDWAWTNVRAAPLFADDGSLRKWVGMNIDVSARKQAQQALSDSEERLHSLMEGLPQLIWRAGAPGRWTWASPQWTAYTGQSFAASLEWGWLDVVHPEDRDAAQVAWAEAETTGFQVEFRLKSASDGLWRWFQTRATPVRGAEGRIIEWLGTSTDVDELHGLQEHQRVLVAELQHRTRNLLAVVRQIAQRTQLSAHDLEDFGQRFRDRLDMLARVQGLISSLDEQSTIRFDELVDSALSAVAADPGERVSVHGPDNVTLRPIAVQMLAMALHELATNAVKHGALSPRGGRLALRWHVSDDNVPLLHIDWRESGVAMTGAEPAFGQGRELIERALPYQLDASTRFMTGQDGIHCTISLPL